jgi:hypothetical protein
MIDMTGTFLAFLLAHPLAIGTNLDILFFLVVGEIAEGGNLLTGQWQGLGRQEATAIVTSLLLIPVFLYFKCP